MSHMDLEKLNPHELVAQYVLELRAHGAALAYEDYEIIDEWIQASGGDADYVLFILSSLLTENKPVRLSALRRKVLKKIDQRAP